MDSANFWQGREHRNLWKRCLCDCWSWDKNRNKAECWLTNVPNYRDFLTDKCSCQLFSHHNSHCWFPVRRQKKIMHGKPANSCQKGEAVNAPGGFWCLGKAPCKFRLTPTTPQAPQASHPLTLLISADWFLGHSGYQMYLVSNRISAVSSISGFQL